MTDLSYIVSRRWCPACQTADTMSEHKQECLVVFGKARWWPWPKAVKCECPHNDRPWTAKQLQSYLGVRNV